MTDHGFFGSFGWLPSSTDKKYKHGTLYSWNVFMPFVAASVEKFTTLDPNFRSWYNQGNRNACVGASTAQLMAQINLSQLGAQKYDWWQHYCWACENDHDNYTTCQRDVGTFLWTGLDALRLLGAYLVGEGWKSDLGLEQYKWINPTRAVDESRTAIAEGQYVSCGSPWMEGFNPNNLVKVGDKWWFPARGKWGKSVGGHAYGWYDASDNMQAFGMVNSWGTAYPEKVYMKYLDYEFLHTIGAETAVLIDKTYVPPVPPSLPSSSASASASPSESPPEPPTSEKEYIDFQVVRLPDQKTFVGRANEV